MCTKVEEILNSNNIEIQFHRHSVRVSTTIRIDTGYVGLDWSIKQLADGGISIESVSLYPFESDKEAIKLYNYDAFNLAHKLDIYTALRQNIIAMFTKQ